jgi:hypothetical protein
MRIPGSVVLVIGLMLGVAGLSAALAGGPRIDASSRVSPRAVSPGVHQHATQTAGQASSGLAIAVDGAVNPELVPDERAWDLFLRAMAAAEVTTRDVALTKVGLGPADRAAFGGALGSLRGDLAALADRRQAGERPDRVRQDEARTVHNARLRVAQSLSPDGRAHLDACVTTEVKRRTRLYRGPMPAPGGVQ